MEEPKSYSIKKLSESNYCSWSQVVKSHLDDQGLCQRRRQKAQCSSPLTATTSEAVAAVTKNHEMRLEKWTKKAKKARKMIISTITPSIMTYIEGTHDPAEMWNILKGWYKLKSSVTLQQLQYQLNTMKIMNDDGNMENHLQMIERLKWQIEEQGEMISDCNYISVLLNDAPGAMQGQRRTF